MNKAIQGLEFDKILERIAKHASFSLGRDKVLNTVPSFRPLFVQRSLNELKDAMLWIEKYSYPGFAGISDVSSFVVMAEKGRTLVVSEIIDIGRLQQGTLRILKSFQEKEENFEHLEDLFTSLAVNEKLIKHIDHCFDESGGVLDRASSDLMKIRLRMRQIDKELEDKTQNFLRQNKQILSEQVVSYQHGRRTFLIKPAEKNKLDGTIYGSSASGQSVYFEPAVLGRLQNEYQGLLAREADEIQRICQETSALIAVDAGQILANLETLALIDALFAKADWGYINHACVAELSEDELDLVQARHPLIERQKAVANDYHLAKPQRMILISGPNTGGKSVSLKTMGLAVMMTLAGCPILALRGKVMMVDALFVDIGDQQSIEKSLSSFSAHIETITEVTRHATRSSLILLDELGSQTDPLEGESLSMAILDYFRQLGCFVIATTHFSKLKQYGTQHEDILVASLEFDLKSLSPTYHYREGILGESNAFAIAKRLELDAAIIDAAFKYKQESQYEADHLLEILEAKITEQENIKKALKEREAVLDLERQGLEEKREEDIKQMKRREESLQAQFDEKVEALIQTAQEQLEILNQTHRPDKRKEAVEAIEKLQVESLSPQNIEVGMRVRLKSSHQSGIVESIEKNTAFVLIGALRMSVDLKQLEALPETKKKSKSKGHSVKAISKPQFELNIIGKTTAEANLLVNKYLDDCVVWKLGICRIVHGHGSGKLRNAVHDLLRRHKHVASFELAPVNEGGAGATVVTLKS